MSSPQPSPECVPVPRQQPRNDKIEKSDIRCHNCDVTKTPVWRRDPGGMKLCNACGLFFKTHKFARPVWMNDVKKRGSDSSGLYSHDALGRGQRPACGSSALKSQEPAPLRLENKDSPGPSALDPTYSEKHMSFHYSYEYGQSKQERLEGDDCCAVPESVVCEAIHEDLPNPDHFERVYHEHAKALFK
ncbi:hypothetical protein CVT26_007586 [Gymnopilus dilepis]|uniref:GATA-type domain-containing protein n=1 Tax=Gymnopilus dilepis TaxID=231916 RepID=A0A409WI59_9AGAR|nr:hypothetical protein CVT26_007586 [Gymnopilus dilepis]